MPEWTIFERVGVPLGVLIFFALAVWRVLKWMGEKVVQPIAASHIELIDSTKKMNAINSSTLQKVGEVLEAQSKSVDKIYSQNNELVQLTQETNRLLSLKTSQ